MTPTASATVPETTIGLEATVTDEPTPPFQHEFYAEEPHLAGALRSLGDLMAFVEEHIDRPMGERVRSDAREEA
jgi:hypothetical protein